MTIDENPHAPSNDETDGEGGISLFISYSRKDRKRVERLYDTLNQDDELRVFRDTDDILPTEEWKPRLEGLIHAADTIIFALSPHSVTSEVCAWELELAESLHKRIIPVVVDNVDGDVPPVVSKLNYIFLTEQDDFDRALQQIDKALRLDIDWIREHTRLAALASRWEQAQKLGAQPLRGKELEDAENWLARQPTSAPQPTSLHRLYIYESRRLTTKRQRQVVAFAALGLILFGALAAFAFFQRQQAVENEQIAVKNEAAANRERDNALANESRFRTVQAKLQLDADRPVEAAHIVLSGLPDKSSPEELKRTRPLVPAAVDMLKRIMWSVSEQAVLYRHPDMTGIRLGPNKRYLVSTTASETGEAVLYDLEQRKILLRLAEDTFRVGHDAVAFNRTGEYMALGSKSGHVRIYRFDTLEIAAEHQVFETAVTTLGFVGGSDSLVASAQGGKTRMLDAESGQVSYEVEGLYSALSDDGSRMAALTSEGMLTIHDLAARTALTSTGPWRGPTGTLARVSFSPDAKWLVGRSHFKVWLFEAATAQAKRVVEIDQIGAPSFFAAKFSPDGKWFATGARHANVFDIATVDTVATYPEHSEVVTDISVRPDGKVVLTASIDGTLRLWTTSDGETLTTLKGHQSHVIAGRFLSDNRQIVSASSDGTVRLWALPQQVARSTMLDEHGSILLSPDKRYLAVGGVGVFDFASGRKLIDVDPDLEYGWTHNSFSSDGARVIAQRYDDVGPVEACVVALPEGTKGHCFEANSSDLSQDDTTVVVSVETGLRTFDAGTGTQLAALITPGFKDEFFGESSGYNLLNPRFSARGQRIVAQRTDNRLLVYPSDFEGDAVTLEGEISEPLTLEFFASDQRILAVWIDTSTVHVDVWGASTGGRVFQAELEGSYTASPAGTSSTGKYIAIALQDGIVHLLDADTGTIVAKLDPSDNGQTSDVSGVDIGSKPEFNDDDTRLMVSNGPAAHIWELKTFSKTDTLPDMSDVRFPSTFAAAFISGGKEALTWTWQGPQRWRLFDNVQALVEHAHEKLPRCLSARQRIELFLPEEQSDWCLRYNKPVSE